MEFKLINFVPYLEYIKGFQDTPQQATDIDTLIANIGNDYEVKIVTTNPSNQDEEEWQCQMD